MSFGCNHPFHFINRLASRDFTTMAVDFSWRDAYTVAMIITRSAMKIILSTLRIIKEGSLVLLRYITIFPDERQPLFLSNTWAYLDAYFNAAPDSLKHPTEPLCRETNPHRRLFPIPNFAPAPQSVRALTDSIKEQLLRYGARHSQQPTVTWWHCNVIEKWIFGFPSTFWNPLIKNNYDTLNATVLSALESYDDVYPLSEPNETALFTRSWGLVLHLLPCSSDSLR